MTYYVKLCPKCGAINHPTLTSCRECKADLPDAKSESDLPAPNPIPRPFPTPHQEPLPHSRQAPAYVQPSIAHAYADDLTACRIVDIEMPFWSMVTFMVKWAIAAIPAFIILIIFAVLAVAVLGAIGAIGQPWMR